MNSTWLVVCNAVRNATFFRQPFMAMLIFAFALASFSIATELLSKSSCFDCKKVVKTKNSYWPCAGLKVYSRKVSQEAASEGSNKNLPLSSREAHGFKGCLHRVRRLEEQLELSQQVSGTIEKKLFTVFSNVHELLCKRKSHELQCKRKC